MKKMSWYAVVLVFAFVMSASVWAQNKTKSCVRSASCTIITYNQSCLANCDQQVKTCSQPCVTRHQTCISQASQRNTRCYQASITHCRNLYPNDPRALTAPHKQCLNTAIAKCQQNYQSDMKKCQDVANACYNACTSQKAVCVRGCMTTRKGRQTCRWKKQTRFGRTICMTPKMCTVCR